MDDRRTIFLFIPVIFEPSSDTRNGTVASRDKTRAKLIQRADRSRAYKYL